MITNPSWHKPKEKPYFHQISLDCVEKLVDCIKRFNNDEIDAEVAEKCAFKVEIVLGSYDNIKITIREDLKLAESLLIDH
jgi:2-C-methyl-D-erythritol 4-phosphate cytidylyltransferase